MIHHQTTRSVLFIGGGYANCCAARMLTDLGHTCIIFERSDRLGGMAQSFYLDGLTYEFGPHILANHGCKQEVIDFLTRFIDVQDTTIDTASFLEGLYLSYPPNMQDVPKLREADIIIKELLSLPHFPDETNFETYLISKVGYTIYSLYYKQFTEKFWHVDPRKLHSDWAKLRHLGESLIDKRMFFHKSWCTYPTHDYNELFRRITKGIKVLYNTSIKQIDWKTSQIIDTSGHRFQADFIVSTVSIDRLFGYKYGALEYSGYDIKPIIVSQEYFHPMNSVTRKHYGMVYYPESKFSYTRITEYKSFNHKEHDPAWKNRTIITIETPSKTAKFYPYMDVVNEDRLRKYLMRLAQYPRVVSLGRLGLYKYTTLDTTTAQIMRFTEYFPIWKDMTSKERFEAYLYIRGSWAN